MVSKKKKVAGKVRFISESSRLCGTLFLGQMVEIRIGYCNYQQGDGRKNNPPIIQRRETEPEQDRYPYPDRQINRSEDFVDTPTPSSRLQVYVAFSKSG